MSEQNESLMKFPCQFSIKAMGLHAPDLDTLVVEIVRRHAPEPGDLNVTSRASKGGKYLSVTVTFEASSRQQLDSIYQELTDHERILMSL